MTGEIDPWLIDGGSVVPTEWIVAFEPDTSIWWGRFLAPGFGHCFAFGLVIVGGRPVWIYCEALVSGTRFGVVPDGVVKGWLTLANLGKMRLLVVPPQGNVVVRPRFMVTCAGAIGSVLGLRRLPVTPRGLFWMLRRLGAREIGQYPHEEAQGASSGNSDTGGAGYPGGG